MAGSNLDTLNRIYDGWSQGDFSGAVEEFAPDVTMVIDTEIPDAGTYEGVEGMASYTRQFLAAWETLTMTPKEFTEVGDDVVLVSVVQEGVGRGSGIEMDLHYFHVWTLRDGKVTELQSILREPKAREAAGLSQAE